MRSTRRLNLRGFTLIELMIVLAIMGAVAVLSMPYITNRNSETKKFLRQFTVLSRELHTRAKLQGCVYRLVIDLQDEIKLQDKRNFQTYWVERAKAKTVLKADEEKLAAERALETDEAKRKDPKGFEPDNSLVKGHTKLPKGLMFSQVELTRLKDPLNHGKAFIHYMPQGLVDEAAIHIKGEKKQAWTILINPLTGRADLISKKLDLKDTKSQ